MANMTSASGLSGLPSDLVLQKWPTSIGVLLISLLAIFLKVTWQPAFPKAAPKLIREWPILGALRLYGKRKAFFDEAVGRTTTGNFSTYMGKFQVIGLSGLEARQCFFENRDFSINEG